jgi:DNA-binding winged helix-turn-helix (wHTH) protein/tetratricopeptide (TPR) repeat protein
VLDPATELIVGYRFAATALDEKCPSGKQNWDVGGRRAISTWVRHTEIVAPSRRRSPENIARSFRNSRQHAGRPPSPFEAFVRWPGCRVNNCMASAPKGANLIRFHPFALDAPNARLYRGDEVIPLRGKTLAVLEYLVARPGQLVTKDELLKEIWPDVYVSEDVLVGCVRELRQVFGDTRSAARFVETVYRRGYRWIAGIADIGGGEERRLSTLAGARQPMPIFVGREADVAQLRSWLAHAASGVRQVVFVTGEAGIGKTALVDAFLGDLLRAPCLVARGQCIEQYGPAEPFLPLLDALVRLGREPDNTSVASTLERCLPDPLLSPVASRSVPRAAGIMPERAVRLLGGAVEAVAAEGVIVLVLEDLHWSDPSTIDVLSYVAQRSEPCRLMVLATYRPTDVILRRHPLRGLASELRARRRSEQLALGRLTVDAVHQWLGCLCSSPPQALVAWLYRRTDGHPLFLLMLFEALAAAGVVACDHGEWNVQPGYAEFGVPESLRLMIDQQAERLNDADRILLEAASTAGSHFSAASVAAAVEQDIVSVEARCDALACESQFLRAAGPWQWPDGTVSGGYRFSHELYRSVFYENRSPARGRLLHRRIGERLERAYGSRADELATELSVHFDRGGDPARAVAYLEKVAADCNRRGAYREATASTLRALEIVSLQPDTPERTDRVIFLNLQLGASLLVAENYADPAVEAAFQRVQQLAEQANALPPLLTALAGLHGYHAARAHLTDAGRIVPRMIELAERLPLPQASLVAHTCASWLRWNQGELARAREHGIQAITGKPVESMSFPSTFDLVGYAFGTAAFVEMVLGNVDAARARSEEGLAWSRQSTRPVDRATALALAGMLHAFMNEPSAAGKLAREAVAVADEHGYRQWRAIGRFIAAWASADAERNAGLLGPVMQSLDEYTRMGLRAVLSSLLCLAARAHIRAGRKQAAMELLSRAEAHVRESGERWYEAELHRLRGTIVQSREPRTAEVDFRQAIDLARAQGAKLWELRATVDLATLWRQEEKQEAARNLLQPVLTSFANDVDAVDLQAARQLYARLA